MAPVGRIVGAGKDDGGVLFLPFVLPWMFDETRKEKGVQQDEYG